MYQLAYQLTYHYLLKEGVKNVKFIKPKYHSVESVTFQLSHKTRSIIEHYSDYSGLSQSQVLEEFLQNILADVDFLEHIERKRNNIRIKNDLGLADG